MPEHALQNVPKQGRRVVASGKKCHLCEETLTDGSTVFNLSLPDGREPFILACLSEEAGLELLRTVDKCMV